MAMLAFIVFIIAIGYAVYCFGVLYLSFRSQYPWPKMPLLFLHPKYHNEKLAPLAGRFLLSLLLAMMALLVSSLT